MRVVEKVDIYVELHRPITMMRNFGGGRRGMMRTEDRQSAFVKLLEKQGQVIEKLSDRVGTRGHGYMDTYDDYYQAPGPMRMRGRGRPQMMGQESFGGRPGSFGPRGGGMSGFGGPRGGMGPRGPGPFGSRDEANDPKFLKQCKLYLENIKKNIPSNKDSLAIYCVACSFQGRNKQDLASHRNTAAHINQLSRIQRMPDNIRREVKKAINDVRYKRDEQKTLMFCDLCDEKLTIPYSDHKNIVHHQIRSKAVRVGCVPCKTGAMKSYPAYKEHCDSEAHAERSKTFNEELNEKINTCTKLVDFPSFQEGVLFGTGHVREIEGYYCTLCRKFLHDKEEMEIHSKLQRHFNHVRDEFFNVKRIEPLDMGEYTLPEQPEETEEKKEETEAETEETEETEAAVDQANGDSENKAEEDMETS